MKIEEESNKFGLPNIRPVYSSSLQFVEIAKSPFSRHYKWLRSVFK